MRLDHLGPCKGLLLPKGQKIPRCDRIGAGSFSVSRSLGAVIGTGDFAGISGINPKLADFNGVLGSSFSEMASNLHPLLTH